VPHQADAVAILDGKWGLDGGAGEVCRSQTHRDADRQRKDGHGGQTGMFHEHPQPELDVEPPGAEPTEGPRRAPSLFDLVHSTQPDVSQPSGLRRRHARAQISVDLQSQVRMKLGVQLTLQLIAPEQTDESP
jgi:hypothetical protein